MDSFSTILDPNRQPDRRLIGFVAILAAVVLLALLDMQWDVREGLSFQHVAIEKSLLLAGLVGVAVLVVCLTRARRKEHQAQNAALQLQLREAQLSMHAESLAKRLVATEGEIDRWKHEARKVLEGLGLVVDDQFERWKLTPAERDVGLLLLKGLSHKEVAEIRKTSEATVRQQAQAIYRKSGLTNRSDLAAYFLEDLLSPIQEGSLAKHALHWDSSVAESMMVNRVSDCDDHHEGDKPRGPKRLSVDVTPLRSGPSEIIEEGTPV